MGAMTSMVLTAVGSASNVMGAYSSAAGTKTNLQSRARMADINAGMSESAAQQELLKGQRTEQQIQLRTGQLKSDQRAAMAANGIDLSSMTAQNILNTTEYMGDVDENTANANAVRSAWGYRTQAVNQQNEARMARATASGIKPAQAAFSTLLTEGGKVASQWYTMNKAGAFNKDPDPLGTWGKNKGAW